MTTPQEIALNKMDTEDVRSILALIKDPKQVTLHKSALYRRFFFEAISRKITPLRYIETREGAKDKQGNPTVLEYFKEEYTFERLETDFAGWWMEDMEFVESERYPTGRVNGYLCVRFPTLSGGEETIKRWATASAKQNSKLTGGVIKYSQPDDLEKKALTEWYKIAGKRYGFGMDLYHQKITPDHYELFTEIVDLWKPKYSSKHRDEVKLYTTGMKFRQFVLNMPTKKQTQVFNQLMKNFQEERHQEMVDALWSKFITLSNNTHGDRTNTENFLTKIKDKIGGLNG